ncbi:MAG: four helix bundle protein [Elusimicrobia bacterium]|nr:four helix bundle protein [Elusimicrobiota bacterium]
MEEKRLENRIFNFAVSTAKFVGSLLPHNVNMVIYRQLLRSALSIGANWQEAAGGLTDADFTHSANIAKKEARETTYWLKIMKELKIGEPAELNALYTESCELVLILTSIVKKIQNKRRPGISKNILVAFLSLILNPLAFSLSSAADWPTFRGNRARTGYSAEQAAPPLTKTWEYQAGADIISSPAVFDDAVYFGARDGWIYALKARAGNAQGELLWRFKTGGWVDASPSVWGNAVYVPSLDGYLYALNRRTGAMLWKARLGASSASSPLVLDGKVFVGSGSPEKKLKVFNALTGKFLFEYRAGQPVDSAPSTDGTRVYFGTNDGAVYVLDKNNFSSVWSYETRGGNYGMSAVAVSSGIVYALPGYDENKPLALSVPDGRLLNRLSGPFEESDSWEQLGSPVVAGDRVYFSGGASKNTLYAMAAYPVDDALQYVWPSSPTLGNTSKLGILSSPAMVNELIYTGVGTDTGGGGLVAVDSTGASVPLTADVNFPKPVYSSPGISNGMVFIAATDGKIKAYKAERIVSISNPREDELLTGTVPVKGYISNPGLTGYTLEYSTGGNPIIWQTIISSAAAQAVENGTLADWNTADLPNGNYALRLTAQGSGTGNTALLAARVNHAPPAPSGLIAGDVAGDRGNKIGLDWFGSASIGITVYRIYRRKANDVFMEIASVSSGTLAYLDATAVTGTTFTYTVRAFDGYVESENSNFASAWSINNSDDKIPPAAINNLTAGPGPLGGMVDIVWTAPGDDGSLGAASHYVIRYTTNPDYDWSDFDGTALSGGTRTVEGPAGAREADDVRGLFGGVTYYIAVKTVDFVSNISPLSNIAASWAAIDLVPPLPVSELVVADTPDDEGGSLTLAWTLSPDDRPRDKGGDVYGYKIYRRTQTSTYISSSPFITVSKGVSAYLDNTAAENVRFYYSAAAFDSTNNSQLSNEASGISADNWRFCDVSQGCSVRLQDGAVVDIPPGAVSQNGKVIFTRLTPAASRPLSRIKANTQAKPTAVVYEAKLKNPIKFIKPAVLTLPFTDAEVEGMDVENLRLYTISDGVWKMLNTSSVDAQAKKVSAAVNHFSVFSIMEYVPSGVLLAEEDVYTYPNPAKGDTVTFKFKLSYKAYVKVAVYNVAGEQVASLEKANCPAGQTSEIAWGVKNIASGIYIYHLRAESASGSKTVTKKLAIIH